MIVKYKFVDGTIIKIDTVSAGASQAVDNVLKRSQRYEWAVDKREGCHTFSLEAKDYEGSDYGYYDAYFEAQTRKAELEQVHKILDLFTEIERRRAMMLYRGMSQTQIAAQEGVSIQSVNDSVRAMRKKIKKFWKKP